MPFAASRRNWWTRNGAPATSSNGFGVSATLSPRREPTPPARMHTGGSSVTIVAVVEPVSRFHDVLGPPAYFVIDPSDVFARNAEREKLNATEERDDDDDRRVSDRE